MNLTEMRGVLAKRDIQLTKSLGQNFLHDANQLQRIVEAAELSKHDKVLEVGPGLGPLTELLLEKAGEVFAIEKDGRLVDFLCERFGLKSDAAETTALTLALSPEERENVEDASLSPTHPNSARSANNELPPHEPPGVRPSPGAATSRHERAMEKSPTAGHSHLAAPEDGRTPVQGFKAGNSLSGNSLLGVRENESPDSTDASPNLGLLHDDALKFLKREPRDWSDWKLVANLPYSVASPILIELAQMRGRPERMVVTLQLEVAQRLMSQAGEDDYGLLTLLVKLDYEPRDWFKIPTGCFFPEPDVESACVILRRRSAPLLSDQQRVIFVKIVKRAFSQRRKMMLKLLKQDWPLEKLKSAFEELNISPMERGEKLSLEQFVELTRKLAN